MRKFMLTNGDDFEHNLEAKLQFMINNYCDHEWNYNQYEMPINCAKCNIDYKS